MKTDTTKHLAGPSVARYQVLTAKQTSYIDDNDGEIIVRHFSTGDRFLISNAELLYTGESKWVPSTLSPKPWGKAEWGQYNHVRALGDAFGDTAKDKTT